MARWVRLCRLDELREDRAFGVEVDGARLAIFRAGEAISVLSGRCPHANGPMGRAWVEDGEAVCPLHHWHFRLVDGRCTTVRGASLHRFVSEVRDGEVWGAI